MYLNVVLGTLEMQWRLVSFIRKVSSPYDNWSQARMINELLSTTSYHCYLGNKYLIHAYSCSIQPLVGCILTWNSYFENMMVLTQYSYIKLLIAYLSNLRRRIQLGIYINHVYDSPIPNMPFSNLLHIYSSKSSYVQYWWNCNLNPCFWFKLQFRLSLAHLGFVLVKKRLFNSAFLQAKSVRVFKTPIHPPLGDISSFHGC